MSSCLPSVAAATARPSCGGSRLRAARAAFAGGRGGQASTVALAGRAPQRVARAVRAAAADATATFDNMDTEDARELYSDMKVSQFMTSPCVSIAPDCSVEEAIKLLVDKGISGVPVTDPATKKVLGVVSGFDIIALDKTPGHVDRSDGMFPKVGTCEVKYKGDTKRMWGDFLELKEVASRASSETVGQIMHDAYTISQDASMEEAAGKVITDKVHRLTVLDAEGRLVGVLSRGDIMRATLRAMQASIE